MSSASERRWIVRLGKTSLNQKSRESWLEINVPYAVCALKHCCLMVSQSWREPKQFLTVYPFYQHTPTKWDSCHAYLVCSCALQGTWMGNIKRECFPRKALAWSGSLPSLLSPPFPFFFFFNLTPGSWSDSIFQFVYLWNQDVVFVLSQMHINVYVSFYDNFFSL